MSLGAEIPKAQIKEMDGFSKTAQTVRAYLIAQLGKNDSIAANPLNLDMILDRAYSQLIPSWQAVAGRVVLIECDQCERLIELYTKSGFKELQVEGGLVQMWRRYLPD